MFLEMSLCFTAYCAAIKHLLGRQLIYQACLLLFFFFSLPQRSDPLKVLFTNLSSSQGNDESENHSPAHKFTLDNSVFFLSFMGVRVFSL